MKLRSIYERLTRRNLLFKDDSCLFQPFLQILQYVYSLWEDEVASNVSKTLEGAKIILYPTNSCDLMEETTHEDKLLEMR